MNRQISKNNKSITVTGYLKIHTSINILQYYFFIQGRTELHDAAERGDVKAVQRLLNTSLNINSRTEDVRL